MAGLVRSYWRYPESAKPSVFPTNSSMFTSVGFDLVLVVPTKVKHIYMSEILKRHLSLLHYVWILQRQENLG